MTPHSDTAERRPTVLLGRALALVAAAVALFFIGTAPAHALDLGTDAGESVETVTEPVEESVAETTETVTEPVEESVAETTETVTEPVEESVAETTESVTEPVEETVAETAETVTEAIVETTETVIEPVEETVTEAVTQVESTTATVLETTSEVVTETTETVTGPVAEVITDTVAGVESSTDPPVVETATDTVSEPVARIGESAGGPPGDLLPGATASGGDNNDVFPKLLPADAEAPAGPVDDMAIPKRPVIQLVPDPTWSPGQPPDPRTPQVVTPSPSRVEPEVTTGSPVDLVPPLQHRLDPVPGSPVTISPPVALPGSTSSAAGSLIVFLAAALLLIGRITPRLTEWLRLRPLIWRDDGLALAIELPG